MYVIYRLLGEYSILLSLILQWMLLRALQLSSFLAYVCLCVSMCVRNLAGRGGWVLSACVLVYLVCLCQMTDGRTDWSRLVAV